MKRVDYKKMQEELDGILLKMQDKSTDVDEALELYERGSEIIKDLEKYLKTAENKIKKIQVGVGAAQDKVK